jgi:hypothetical protein
MMIQPQGQSQQTSPSVKHQQTKATKPWLEPMVFAEIQWA